MIYLDNMLLPLAALKGEGVEGTVVEPVMNYS
jgi:hypothetical protein